MQHPLTRQHTRNQRVRAIVITDDQRVLFIKRIKPNKTQPYWVAPGGGVEEDDTDILQALHRELYEELGAEVEVIQHGFVLRHEKANKHLEEHFYVCRLVRYDLSQRHGPEFDDPTRGEYIPHAIELTEDAITSINIKTTELQDWLINNLPTLKAL
ncbi:MAG: NUDIX domain-containing protein [Anaerolineae bacterium]